MTSIEKELAKNLQEGYFYKYNRLFRILNFKGTSSDDPI